MQILRKLPLSTLDTFMFNDARSSLSETRCYDVFENIKDGSSIASKHSSEMIQFKTPNVVIVFSDADPDMTQLSKDWWKVFYSNKDWLSSQEKRLLESRSSRKWSHHCTRFSLYWNVTFTFNCEVHDVIYIFDPVFSRFNHPWNY